MFTTAVIAFTLGISCHDEEKHEIICETSDASPMLHHVDELIKTLEKDKKTSSIYHKGLKEGTCGGTRKKWSGNGGAVFALCRTEGDDLKLQVGDSPFNVILKNITDCCVF